MLRAQESGCPGPTEGDAVESMLALVKNHRGPGLAVESVAVPSAGTGEVVIRVLKTAICGTDVHIYAWDEWAQRTLSVPQMAVLSTRITTSPVPALGTATLSTARPGPRWFLTSASMDSTASPSVGPGHPLSCARNMPLAHLRPVDGHARHSAGTTRLRRLSSPAEWRGTPAPAHRGAPSRAPPGREARPCSAPQNGSVPAGAGSRRAACRRGGR